MTLAQQLAELTPADRAAVLAGMSDAAIEALLWDWRGTWARPAQLAPGTPGADLPDKGPATGWRTWLVLAGRGFGKTRTGAEWVIERARTHPGCHIALVGPTMPDVKKTMLSSGMEHIDEAPGILRRSPPGFRPVYEPSKNTLTWPNGTVATMYSADEPERLRGPQHHAAWADEVRAWRYREAWDMLLFGLRLGADPCAVATTTPRPSALLRELIADPFTAITRRSTKENVANLAPVFLQQVVGKFAGTRLARQELEAEMLDDTPGALWTLALIDAHRTRKLPEFTRIVVAVDPAVSSTKRSAETGIVVVGIAECWATPACAGAMHGYLLDDLSGRWTPSEWAERVVNAYDHHQADAVIGEVNNGGDLVESNIRTVAPNINYKSVHASRGKRTRAEPVSSLYQQAKFHHVGAFPELEDQMTTWDASSGEDSPDRMDALVHGATELMLTGEENVLEAWGKFDPNAWR